MSMGNTINTITVPVTPIGATPQWVAAVAAADGQCQHEQASKVRCQHTQSGGYRLYVHTDGRVYCDTHIGPHQAADAPAPRRSRRAAPGSQGGPDLFDLLAELDAEAEL